MLREICAGRGIMPIWDHNEESWEKRRNQILELLCREEYGFLPRVHDRLEWEIVEEDKIFCAGKVTLQKVMLTASFGEDKFSFPIYVAIPNVKGKYPFFIQLNFRDSIPDKFLPVEEICDRGFAVISLCYLDISVDYNWPFSTGYGEGLNDVIFRGIQKKGEHCGKLALWAWAASRAMDYAQSLDCLDFTRAAVVGHSRLGKTALLAGALDERFTCAISNDSGSCGAAAERGKSGEDIPYIIKHFGYWFCDNFKKYAENPAQLPFDQHFLLAAMAPRKVYVASAAEDDWADPYTEYLTCFAASEVYEKLGMKGFECPDRMPEIGERFHNGNIGYHLRAGTHYFGREDWMNYMDYMER